MTHPNTSIRDNDQPSTKQSEVDEYTAKMDRMVNGLRKRSQIEHHKESKSKLIWILIAIIMTIVSIFIMLNITFEGEPVKFLMR